jgi:hypothetical protein
MCRGGRIARSSPRSAHPEPMVASAADQIHPAELVPAGASLPIARLAASGCRACELWERATQTVFGEGPTDARLFLAGEQPGDREDIEGHVFVGPAGRVLDEALEAAGIDREKIFVTNVVKHFRWRPSGKAAAPRATHRCERQGLPAMDRARAGAGQAHGGRCARGDRSSCLDRPGREANRVARDPPRPGRAGWTTPPRDDPSLGDSQAEEFRGACDLAGSTGRRPGNGRRSSRDGTT